MEHLSFFDKIQNHLDSELPMVIFSKPNENRIQCFLQPTNILRTNTNFNTPGFVFSPFEEGNEKKVWMYKSECEFLCTDFIEKNSSAFKKENNTSKIHINNYLSVVNKAIVQLKLGELQKVVISRSEFHFFEKKEPLEWFKSILGLYANAFCYCWYHPKIGMWLGASPETLISLSKNKFQTMALAGTMPFKGTENVTWGIKEKEEQQLVVDSIIKGLKPVTTKVEKGETTTQKAGVLLHLKTIISGELNTKKDIKVLVEELHPTSAVCGLPKVKSKEFILSNEDYNRSYYTGYLGFFDPNSNTQLFVNLRCMQIHENKAEIYVGGGITALSNAEAELEETVNKSQIMKVIL